MRIARVHFQDNFIAAFRQLRLGAPRLLRNSAALHHLTVHRLDIVMSVRQRASPFSGQHYRNITTELRLHSDVKTAWAIFRTTLSQHYSSTVTA